MDQEIFKVQSHHWTPRAFGSIRSRMEGQQIQCSSGIGDCGDNFSFEPLSVIAADDPVTCTAYAIQHDLHGVEGWHRFRNLAPRKITSL